MRVRALLLKKSQNQNFHARQSIAAISAALAGMIIPFPFRVQRIFEICIRWHFHAHAPIISENLRILCNFRFLFVVILLIRLLSCSHSTNIIIFPVELYSLLSLAAQVASHQIVIFTMTSQESPRNTINIYCKTKIELDRGEIRWTSFGLRISNDGLP